jgi:hypothetical protein
MYIACKVLNKITVTMKNMHPLPCIDDLFYNIKGANYFTTFDVITIKVLWMLEMPKRNLYMRRGIV